MKRSSDSERKKKRKRQKLLQELGGQHIPFLSPTDTGFQQLWESSYSGLALRQAESLPSDLHERVRSALRSLQRRGCLFRDLVRIRGRDVFTAVSRALVGRPGDTYRYLGTRLFALPWHEEERDGGAADVCCDRELSDACRALWELNQFFCQDVERREAAGGQGGSDDPPKGQGGSEDLPEGQGVSDDPLEGQGGSDDPPGGQGSSEPDALGTGLADPRFNITLLNYMDPAAMKDLKEEPYYGMGKMAVSWHHDENLVPQSPVAVYNCSSPDEKGAGSQDGEVDGACWRVGLKVAWDIHTPGLALPLQSGDCYYMRDDLNRTHQHCVLAGGTPRFSSTHRVAECSTGTLDYIQRRCREALENLHVDPDTGSKTLRSLQPSALQLSEEIHNEVEFEWLRQYWFQGRRCAPFCSWWSKPMEQLEESWDQMESMTQLALAAAEDEGSSEERRREVAETLLAALTDRQEQRQTWRDRCQSSLAQTLPPEEAPVNRPYWGEDDPPRPLPFDLTDIISRVESLLWRL
ncbi:alpha-ketoglutarate-dependent dioxygenase FTO [Conger conger]|uniref:alpha-ketoglutarate-dependent dioxygenase FTO n=1 Tax=Conger conger TaxID=82655 RepID=UPI002A5A2091|nr:alpha-ketoglutarate-dependent dioxygenase FTO [Conger conger]